ncbi:MAG: AraC family transcriptional regulator [Spirochaetes bacterium]|nr:AraC family transcriptional regulator [Spirochaetota bacterium]MBU1079046.1 AraC family transcriptional regulator [Spirochaetota bacterium]
MNDDERRLASISRALDLVESRLRDRLDVAAMAGAACYSMFHFVRVFTELTGHGPYDYLMRRRVAEAAEEVVSGERPLIDIALEYDFESPEGFARAFRRCFGLSPSEARKARRYPSGLARLAISGQYAKRLLASGLKASPSEEPALSIAGSMADADGPFAIGTEIVVVGFAGEGLAGRAPSAFAGRALGPEEPAPAFPAVSTVVAGGPAVAASVASARDSPRRARIDVGLARDYLYRTAIPVAGAFPRGDVELIRLGPDGGPVELVVPLSG